MPYNRKVILYIAMSVDGYIAQANDDLSFLKMVEQKGEDYGYFDFIKSIDAVVLGRKTYDWVMTQVPVFPHAETETYVITHTPRPAIGNVRFYTGNLKKLITTLCQLPGKNIFIDGGAAVVNALLKDKLIDEFYISVIPVILGGGIRLFDEGFPLQQLQLISSKAFEKGLVQLHYCRK